MTLPIPFSEADERRKEEILQAFRSEFRLFYEDFGEDDTAILSFVHYEGISDRQANGVVAPAEGVIVGEVLVGEFGCEWCVLVNGENRLLAVNHEKLAEPLNLTDYRWSKAQRLLPKRWFTRLRRLVTK